MDNTTAEKHEKSGKKLTGKGKDAANEVKSGALKAISELKNGMNNAARELITSVDRALNKFLS